MPVPEPYAFVLLSLAAYRCWHLLAEDTILEPLRRRVYRLGDWEEGPFPEGYRRRLDDFIGCSWCCGFWIAVAWLAAFWLWPHGTVIAAVPFAVSALVGLLARLPSL